MVPPGEFLGIVPSWVIVYLATLVCFGVATAILYIRMFRPILSGRPSGRLDQLPRRILGSFPYIFGQKKVLQSTDVARDRAGVAHAIIFWGFLSFSLSYLIFIYGDSINNQFSSSLLTGKGIKVFGAYLDILSVSLLVVILLAVLRRWVFTANRLRFDLTQKSEAAIILTLIALLMVTTILAEAFYVAAANTHSHSFIGNVLGDWLETTGITDSSATYIYEASWWIHLAIILGFSVYIPISKHVHLVGAPLAFVTRQLGARGTLTTITDFEEAESFGASRMKDFNQKQLLDAFACAVCGRCTDVCPANLTGKMLSPMHVVQGMRYHIADATSAESEEEVPSVIGSRIEREAVWDCLTCGACTEVCPVGNEPFHPLIDIRRYMVMEEPDIPEGAQGALLNLEQRGHPWSGTTFTRESWYEGLDVQTFSENPEAEYLLWVGCTNALEQRSQSIPRSMVGILNRAKVNFAILGPEETCTGDPARRMGNEYLYQMLAMQNIETFNRYGVKKILTSCPHCFNNIKNEYPHLGGSFEVLHYSELISDLIQQEIIKPVVEINTKLAYHDSCYLGRQNGIYDAPRNVAKSIPGLELIEMEKCRGNGFCCGAGGGHMWFEEGGSQRVNHARTDQFLETNADTVGVSCPFCMQMMEEGVESKGVSESRKVKDLVELLEESLG